MEEAKETEFKSIERHVAGATVSHTSPFSEIEVPTNHEDLSREMIETWVLPLYFGLGKPETKTFVSNVLPLATDAIIFELLTNFNWRPRTAAAHIVALTQRASFVDQIGKLLLRSDVCYAGRAYCIALAELNLAGCVSYLNEYLEHYLLRHDLWFDQGSAMGAIAYLDQINGTKNVQQHLGAWDSFIQNKSGWLLESSVSQFSDQMDALHRLKS